MWGSELKPLIGKMGRATTALVVKAVVTHPRGEALHDALSFFGLRHCRFFFWLELRAYVGECSAYYRLIPRDWASIK